MTDLVKQTITMTKPHVLLPGDPCRADGYLRVEATAVSITDSPSWPSAPFGARAVLAAASEGLWASVEPGVRYSVRGTWDGQLIRAESCEVSQCQERFGRPRPDDVARATRPVETEVVTPEVPGILFTGGFAVSGGGCVTFMHLMRWTDEAVVALTDRTDLAVTVMCGREDDAFLTDVQPLELPPGRTEKPLQAGERARACGYLVAHGQDAYLCPHWNSPPNAGVRLRTRVSDLRGGAYLGDPGVGERDRYLAYVVDGFWDGEALADDGYLKIASRQDFTMVEDVELCVRYDPKLPRRLPQLPLAVLVGHPHDRFVWHRGG